MKARLSVTEESVTIIPPFMVALHRLAVMGKATLYAPGTGRFCKFENLGLMAAKWVPLRDVETVTIIYRERRNL
jgi:hypothetical protein